MELETTVSCNAIGPIAPEFLEFFRVQVYSRLQEYLAHAEAVFLDRFPTLSGEEKEQWRKDYAVAIVDATARAFMVLVEAASLSAAEYLKLLERIRFGPLTGVDWNGTEMRCKVMARNQYWYSVALRIERENATQKAQTANIPAAAKAVNSPIATGLTSAINPTYPKRAAWLLKRLRERSWNKHNVEANCGVAHKTVQKILDGLNVRDCTLESVAQALSMKFGKVSVLDFPQD